MFCCGYLLIFITAEQAEKRNKRKAENGAGYCYLFWFEYHGEYFNKYAQIALEYYNPNESILAFSYSSPSAG